MSVAFTKEDSAETASETQLPDRPISEGPNLVTQEGLTLLKQQLQKAEDAYAVAQQADEINERGRLGAIPLRDMRYFAERVRSAQVMPVPVSTEMVAFGHSVTFKRVDGRVQTYRIVGEDEADPKRGTISFASPVARSLMRKSLGDIVGPDDQELEILEINCCSEPGGTQMSRCQINSNVASTSS